MNASREVLVVKERGRSWWDLPGGGMDHGENLKEAIARELSEEVSLSGEFIYEVLHVEEPAYLDDHGFWQMRLVMQVTPQSFSFQSGGDSDAVEWINPEVFQGSDRRIEQLITKYAQLATR